jgi:hypothetical protein
MTNRLATVAPELIELGERISAEQRKAIACRAAEWACRMTGVLTILDEDPIRLLLDVAHSPTQQERKCIADDVVDLDQRYLSTVEQHDGLDAAGQAMQWFSKARAAASVLYSLDALTVQGFCETLYEAQAATGDLEGLRMLCEQ